MSFLLSKRWLGFAVFCVLLATLCVFLGRWQFHRGEDRKATNARVAAAMAREPIALEDLTVGAEHEWTRITATGEFDQQHIVTVRYAQREGVPGVDVVAPFVLADGSAILVDAGWFQTENRAEAPANIPALPTGELTIEGWWRVNSAANQLAVTPAAHQVRAIDSRAWKVPVDLHSGWVNLQSPQVQGLAPEHTPSMSNGPHFAYGIQWWFFGALAIFGFGWLARAEKIERDKKQRKAQATTQAKATKSA